MYKILTPESRADDGNGLIPFASKAKGCRVKSGRARENADELPELRRFIGTFCCTLPFA